MATTPKSAHDKLSQIIAAWQTLRPGKSFAGLTLDQYKARVQPSFDTRSRIVTLQDQLLALQTLRDEADKASLALSRLVVNAVMGDPAESDDGELYEAMGYVRRSQRASGLHRAAPAPATSAAGTP